MRSGDITGVTGGTGVDLVLHCNRPQGSEIFHYPLCNFFVTHDDKACQVKKSLL